MPMKLHKVLAAAVLIAASFAAAAQVGYKPPPFSPSADGEGVSSAEIGKSRAPEPCVIKPVMSDVEMRRCGARPPEYARSTPPAPAPAPQKK